MPKIIWSSDAIFVSMSNYSGIGLPAVSKNNFDKPAEKFTESIKFIDASILNIAPARCFMYGKNDLQCGTTTFKRGNFSSVPFASMFKTARVVSAGYSNNAMTFPVTTFSRGKKFRGTRMNYHERIFFVERGKYRVKSFVARIDAV